LGLFTDFDGFGVDRQIVILLETGEDAKVIAHTECGQGN
jgi:hypothetical protein